MEAPAPGGNREDGRKIHRASKAGEMESTADERSHQDFPREIFRRESECRPLRTSELDWLHGRGVPPLAVAVPLCLGVAKVVFLGGRYRPSPLGAPALILPVIDHTVVDAVAWRPTTGRVATRLGAGGLLGQGEIGRDGLGTCAVPLPAYRSPLDWLRASRCGVVVVDAKLAAHLLAGVIVGAEDEKHSAEIAALSVPAPVAIAQRRHFGAAA